MMTVSQRVAKRKHVLKKGGKKCYRVKKPFQPKKHRDTSYEPGCEPV